MRRPDAQEVCPQAGSAEGHARLVGRRAAALRHLSAGWLRSLHVLLAGRPILAGLAAVGAAASIWGLSHAPDAAATAPLYLLAGGALLGAAGSAVMLWLVSRNQAPDLHRFRNLGEKLERGIEQLRDLQWELSDNETRYRDLLDSQNDIITRTGSQGRLTFVNRAFCRTFGVEPGAVLGTPFAVDVLARDGEPRRAVEPGRRQRFEELICTAIGPRWFAFEQHAILGEAGSIGEIQLLGRDITEQRRAQESLAEARDQAEAASRAKSRFLAAMSHEIRTPMNGILGMTSLLGETPLSPEQGSYVVAIDQSAKLLLTIINEILDLSKIEAGKLEVHPAPFVLADCMQGIVELMSPRAREKGLDLAWRIETQLPRIVVGDETRIRQILLNLVGNAIKFTDRGGVAVRIKRARLPEAEATGAGADHRVLVDLEVTDTGIGIAPDKAATVFGEFEQVDDVVKRKRSGSGLGLAISRRLAQAMGGDIAMASTPGEGSTFTARLALTCEPSAAAGGLCPAPRPGRRVLIASSRLQCRTLLAETLSELAGPVEICDPDAACEAAAAAGRRGSPFDTLVIDAEMGADAIAITVRTARAVATGPVRALLMVDLPGGGRLEAYRAAGCDAYLVRPVRPSSLAVQLDAPVPHPAAEPAKAAGEAHVSSEAPAAAPAAPHSRHILLVEDNDINALLARRMSEKSGCIVHHAVSGPAALAYCSQVLATAGAPRLDLVLMDIHMPEMDGVETTGRIKALFAEHGVAPPPIVALTANAFAEDRKRCMEAGLDDYLAKPFDRSELEVTLARWCPDGGARRDGAIVGYAA